MKNLLLLLVVLIFSCEVAEIEDFSELTQAEKDAVIDQLEETRDVSYLLDVELDTITMEGASVTQNTSFDGREFEIGNFALRYRIVSCGVGDDKVMGFDYLNTDRGPLDIRNVLEAVRSSHRNGMYRITLIMEADTLIKGVSPQFPCDDVGGGGRNYKIATDSLHLYGFGDNESEFIVRQLNRLKDTI